MSHLVLEAVLPVGETIPLDTSAIPATAVAGSARIAVGNDTRWPRVTQRAGLALEIVVLRALAGTA